MLHSLNGTGALKLSPPVPLQRKISLSPFTAQMIKGPEVIESQVASDTESISKRPMFFRVSRKTTDAQ
ncbi:MAG: hypothetical protein P8O70_16790 [SAR324 cluster bacterium]|nr:hypothetical protein [SAR324 cluster bacterium]